MLQIGNTFWERLSECPMYSGIPVTFVRRKEKRKKILNLGYKAKQQAENNLKCKNLDQQRERNQLQREGTPSLKGKLATLSVFIKPTTYTK